jgi:ferredoxin
VNVPSKNVIFTPLRVTAEAKPDETLLDVARRAGVPLGNSCGAIGVCARCSVRIVSGAENLTAPTAIETTVSQRRKLAPDERLACQAVVLGNCEVTTSYW